MPKRIQRKRTKGWRMPEGAVYVGRPTKWGNPIRITHKTVDVDPYCSTATERVKLDDRLARHWSVDAYIDWLPDGIKKAAREELRGKDLVCWCPLDQVCHADVLLDLANSDTVESSQSINKRPTDRY